MTALRACLCHATKQNCARVQGRIAVPRFERFDKNANKISRYLPGKPTIRPGLAARCAHGIVKENITHASQMPTTKLTDVVALPPTLKVAKFLAPST